MNLLIRLSRAIDGLTLRIGGALHWLVLVAVLVSAGNALVRYLFNISSNAWLEVQWYLFAAIFLLGAGYALLHNQHVRIDVVASRLSRRAQAGIEIFGTLFMLLPIAALLVWLSWPVFVESLRGREVSSNANGLLIWPARLLVPVGFALLWLQGLSELIKRVAFLAGALPDPGPPPSEADEALALAADLGKARVEP